MLVKNININTTTLVQVYCAIVIAIMVLPYIILGEDMYISILDNLEQMPALFGRSKSYGFFTLDVPSGVMDSTSSMYFGWGGFSIVNVFYHLLPPYVAYTLIYILSVFIGFFSMNRLQSMLLDKDYKPIILCTSLFYSISATMSVWTIAIAFIPIVCIALLNIFRKNEHSLLWALSFFIYPFFSEFNGVGIFICGFLLLCVLVDLINQKQINKLLFLAFLMYCFGTIVFHLKLFYMQFIVADELYRSQSERVFDMSDLFRSEAAKELFTHIFKGKYPAPTHVSLVVVIPCCIAYICYLMGEKCIKKDFLSDEGKLGLICVSVVCALSVISILDIYSAFNALKALFPPIKGFDFSRLYVFNRLLWYVTIAAFAIDACKRFSSNKICCIVIAMLLVYQTKAIVMSPCLYNDSVRSVRQHISGVGQSFAPFTWKEFFDEELFSRIKEDIAYKGEPVATVGISPMILVYNKYNSICGFLSFFPYKDAVKFRKLIEPELEENEISRNVFDKYNCRRLLFNSELDLQYCSDREKHPTPILLRIDSKVFKEDYGGKYIFSRAPLSNSVDLGLDFIGKWDSTEGVYTIYVYANSNFEN